MPDPEPAPKIPAAPPPIHRVAIAALVCAGLGFSALPVLGTILGFILAARAQRALAAAPGRYRGEDQIRWARLLGILAIVLWIVGVVAVIVARWFMHHEPMV
jgi:hypothetical protein